MASRYILIVSMNIFIRTSTYQWYCEGVHENILNHWMDESKQMQITSKTELNNGHNDVFDAIDGQRLNNNNKKMKIKNSWGTWAMQMAILLWNTFVELKKKTYRKSDEKWEKEQNMNDFYWSLWSLRQFVNALDCFCFIYSFFSVYFFRSHQINARGRIYHNQMRGKNNKTNKSIQRRARKQFT